MHQTLTSAVAAELRAAAARLSVSQAELARRLDRTTVWVSRRLRGDVPLDVDDLRRFCEVLDLESSQIYAAADAALGQRSTGTEGIAR